MIKSLELAKYPNKKENKTKDSWSAIKISHKHEIRSFAMSAHVYVCLNLYENKSVYQILNDYLKESTIH